MGASLPPTVPGTAVIPVGISACLLGMRVRHDGGHKRDAFCVGELAAWFRWQPVCPESELGLGTPREAIHLRRGADGLRLVGVRSGHDHTAGMHALADHVLPEFGGLCGFVVSKRSPTCGLERVRMYDAQGGALPESTRGLFTARLMARWPLLPVEDEGRLNDPQLRENFVMRVFVLWRWQQLRAAGLTAQRLTDFHAAHKYLLMAHNGAAYRSLGRLLADFSAADPERIADDYIRILMPALATPASRPRHGNVLMHMAGHFRAHLSSAHRTRLRSVIDDYLQGLVPLSAPLTLIRHFLADHPDPWLERQVYLQPYPDVLRLRAFL